MQLSIVFVARNDPKSATTAAAIISEGKVYAVPGLHYMNVFSPATSFVNSKVFLRLKNNP